MSDVIQTTDSELDSKIEAFDLAIRALAEVDQQAALNMLCGHLVGFLSALVALDGGDPTSEITIDGGLTSRSITIHEKKLVLAS
jgi:hypothetical protein